MPGISSNFNGMIGARLFSEMSLSMHRTMERLATGKRINRASDDPSGAIAVAAFKQDQSKLTADIAGKEREMKRLGAYEGAGSVVSELLTDLQGLVTAAANTGGLSKEEREAMAMEAGSIIETIDYLAMSTRFEDQDILQGMASVKLGGSGEFTLSDLRDGGRLNLAEGDMAEAQKVIDRAAGQVSDTLAATGNRVKSLEHEVQADLKRFEAQESARSLIEDADIARETSELVRKQVLQQAAAFAMSMFNKTESDTILHLLG